MLLNTNGTPQIIYDALTRQDYHPVGASDYSATSLIKSPRQVQLEKRHASEIVHDVSDQFDIFVGTAIHSAVEQGLNKESLKNKYLIERKITRTDLDRRVVAKFDAYDMLTKTLSDHKTKRLGLVPDVRSLREDFKQEWADQLNINAYFLETEGYKVDNIAINLIFKDWSKMMARMNGQEKYPQSFSVELVRPAASMAEREAFYLSRLQKHIDAERLPDNELPLCTPEEMWESKPKWSVENINTGRARKLCDTEAEARAWMNANVSASAAKVTHVVFRPGRRVKCENFCDAAPFCNQFKGN